MRRRNQVSVEGVGSIDVAQAEQATPLVVVGRVVPDEGPLRSRRPLNNETERRASPIMKNVGRRPELPVFLTVQEVAELLRTTPKAVYTMAERGLLPGATHIGSRLLVRADDLLSWLDQKRAPSAIGGRR